MKSIKFISSLITPCLVALLGLGYPNIGWTESVKDKIKDWVHESYESIKKGIDDLGDNFDAIQSYLDNYHWKGLVEDEAISGPVTLKHLELNKHSRAIVVKPGEKIETKVECILNPEQVSAFSIYRIVVGIKGEGAQAVIGNELGLIAGTTQEEFILTAPDKSGIYELRFRPVEALFNSTAFEAWQDEKGNEPDGKTTIGIIVVK